MNVTKVFQGISHGVANIAGKTTKYAGGVGSLIMKDVKKIPGRVFKVPSAISKAVRSKIEVNIIMPKDRPNHNQDADITKVKM